MSIDDALERWLNTDQERNIRVNLMRSFEEAKTGMSLLETNLTYFKGVHDKLVENGFVVDTYEEAKDVIAAFCDNPAKLKAMSDKAIELGKSFDWAQLVGTWEDEIIRIYNS